jgi:hypothetical protein
VSEKIISLVTDLIHSTDRAIKENGVSLLLSLDNPAQGVFVKGVHFRSDQRTAETWSSHISAISGEFKETITSMAAELPAIRRAAVNHGVLTTKAALNMPNGLGSLLASNRGINMLLERSEGPITESVVNLVLFGIPSPGPFDPMIDAERLTVVGKHLKENPDILRAGVEIGISGGISWTQSIVRKRSNLTAEAELGGIAVSLILTEAKVFTGFERSIHLGSWLGPFRGAEPYIWRRFGAPQQTVHPTPRRSIPRQFRQIFEDWAEGKTNFVLPN